MASNNSKRINKELLTQELRAEIEGKLDKTGTIAWDKVTDKPQLAHDAWKTPVQSPADLPLTGNKDGDIRLTLGPEKYVFTWDDARKQWMLIGASSIDVDWMHITNKPTTYAPSAHKHVEADITNLDKYTKSEVDTKLSGKANTSHKHPWSDLTNVPTSFTPASHTHSESDIIGLDKYTKSEVDAKLSLKVDFGHTHAISDVTNLQITLDGKALKAHSHAIADVTGLQLALDGKAASSHTHTIANVTGLQSALDAKVSKDGTKVLSTHDFTDAMKMKLDSLTENASVDYTTMLSEHNAHINDTVAHTTSADKALIATIGGKADKTYVDTQLNGKANASTLSGHIDNATIHVTQTEKNTWNGKANATHTHTISDVTGLQVALDNAGTKDVATTTTDGLMSSTDKTKLNGIATGANNYVHPSTHPASMITEDTSRRFVSDADKALIATIAGKADKTYVDTALGGKADKSTFDGHTGNSTIHVTKTQTDAWDAKANASHTHESIDVVDVRTMPANTSNVTSYDPKPIDISGKSISAFFSTGVLPSSSWGSALTVKGWTGSYAAWQIIGGANTSSHGNLYFREGTGSTWGVIKRIATEDDLIAIGTTQPTSEMWYKVIG